MAAIQFENSSTCCKWKTICKRLKKDLLLILIIIGAVLGFIIGAIINSPVNQVKNPESRANILLLLGFPGELLMNMLQMVILPLIIASLITALADLDNTASGKIGRRALLFYLTTTLSASVLGMALVSGIRPGRSDNPVGVKSQYAPYRILDSFLDLISCYDYWHVIVQSLYTIPGAAAYLMFNEVSACFIGRSLFPRNLVEATLRQQKTTYRAVEAMYDRYNQTIDVSTLPVNETITIINNGTHNITTITRLIYPASNTVPNGTRMQWGMNVLGLALFSIVFGFILGQMGEKGQVMRDFFRTLNNIVMKMVNIIMWYAPIGIFSLIVTRVADMEDIPSAVSMLAMFIVTVLTGLFIHAVIVLPLMYFVVTRKNPYRFILGMRRALVTAFGISSSSATLPTTMRCLEENNRVDERISKFVLPLGATVNMDGGALYEAIAAIFIAQISNIDLSAASFIATCLTATAVSIGAAGIPSAGSVTTIIVLQAVNLPLENIGLLMAVDWFLDRFRTTVNVLGDSIGAGIIEHLSRSDLALVDYQARNIDDPSDDVKNDYPNVHVERDNLVMTTM